MKRTIEEQKTRIKTLINETDYPSISHEMGQIQAERISEIIKDAVKEYVMYTKRHPKTAGGFSDSKNNLVTMVNSEFDKVAKELGLSNDNDELDETPSYGTNPHETTEYGKNFNKNMTQGFTINEGNAFVGAAKKAKAEGKDSFKLDGKTYKVTVKKSENKK